MLSISFIVLCSSVLHCYEASPVIVNDEYDRKYETHEDADPASEHTSPYHHSSVLSVRSAQSPSQFNTYPYQALSQFSPYSQYSNQQLQLPNQQSQIAAAAQQGNHQYLAALQQYYAASRRPAQSFSQPTAASFAQPTAAYSQVPITQQSAQLPQAGYQHPLGSLYSAASDVSQFQFSGNGVNYGF